MALHETGSTKVYEVPPGDGREVVKERLRTLLELAVAIGNREGLLGKNGDSDIEGGSYVADKGR